jgi:hypothetical protein
MVNTQCDICIDKFIDETSYKCFQCRNFHCNICHNRIKKCPYCRLLQPFTIKM